jgi:hypothetical protein
MNKYSKETIDFLKQQYKFLTKQNKLLKKYYNASQDAIANKMQGHNLGWNAVHEIADKIDDTYDMSVED